MFEKDLKDYRTFIKKIDFIDSITLPKEFMKIKMFSK